MTIEATVHYCWTCPEEQREAVMAAIKEASRVLRPVKEIKFRANAHDALFVLGRFDYGMLNQLNTGFAIALEQEGADTGAIAKGMQVTALAGIAVEDMRRAVADTLAKAQNHPNYADRIEACSDLAQALITLNAKNG